MADELPGLNAGSGSRKARRRSDLGTGDAAVSVRLLLTRQLNVVERPRLAPVDLAVVRIGAAARRRADDARRSMEVVPRRGRRRRSIVVVVGVRHDVEGEVLDFARRRGDGSRRRRRNGRQDVGDVLWRQQRRPR